MEDMDKKTNKTVKLSDYQILTLLGTGSFGKVKLARRKKDNKIMCVKSMKKKDIINAKQTDHIVNFQGIAQDSKYLHIFMQYVGGGQLFTHLRQQGSFSSQKTIDLKPQNILIGRDGYLKLTDFGFAKKIENRTFTLCGTPQYLAPQVLLNQGHGKPVDWWTLGILIYQMLAGIDPFSDKDPMSVYHNILKGKLRFPADFDSNAKSLVKHLLVADLSKRYGNLRNGVKDIKNHRYLANTPYADIFNKKIKAPFIPQLQRDDDISNFMPVQDSNSQAVQVAQNLDPFITLNF